MKNAELISLNERSNAALERGVAELGERLQGQNIMGLMMNPKKAAAEFGGAFDHLMSGIAGQRAVISELLRRNVEEATDE